MFWFAYLHFFCHILRKRFVTFFSFKMFGIFRWFCYIFAAHILFLFSLLHLKENTFHQCSWSIFVPSTKTMCKLLSWRRTVVMCIELDVTCSVKWLTSSQHNPIIRRPWRLVSQRHRLLQSQATHQADFASPRLLQGACQHLFS